MGKSNKSFRCALFFAAVVMLISWASSSSWAAATVTLCTDKSSFEGSNGTYKVGATRKLKTDGTPLFATYTTTSNNPAMSASADVVLIPAPSPGCKLDNIVINTDSSCKVLPVTDPPSAPHPVEVHFTNCPQSVYFPDVQADADALTPANQLENLYDAARTLTGMTGLPANLAAACTSLGSEQDVKDCAQFICTEMLDELTNTPKQVLINAGQIGQAIQVLYEDAGICFARSGKVVVESGGNGCTVEDIIRTGGLDALTMAPALDLNANLFSDGGGILKVTDLDNLSFASIDMNTCMADFLINQ